MRQIPLSMRRKLESMILAPSLRSAPEIEIIASQASTNIFLTETIHGDAGMAPGSVTIRQMAGETSPSMAYAICIDDGTLAVYSRLFPAVIRHEWAQVFTGPEATYVDIEYDGIWAPIGDGRYYLQTPEFPWLFWVEGGTLYAQLWQDQSTRIEIADNVSSCSACRCWQSNIDPSEDQGLVIGYRKLNGTLYYRALCWSEPAQAKVWESEVELTELGPLTTGIAVTRLNDFRAAFLTRVDGRTLLAISERTYPGQSFPPEMIEAQTTGSSFRMLPIYAPEGFTHEEIGAAEEAFFRVDPVDEFDEIAVESVDRITDGGILTGVRVTFDRDLTDNGLPERFAALTACSSSRIAVTGASVSGAVLTFALDCESDHTAAFTLTWPAESKLTYQAETGFTWPLDGRTIELPFVRETIEGFTEETIEASVTDADFDLIEAVKIYASSADETIEAEITSSTFTYTPIGDVPV